MIPERDDFWLSAPANPHSIPAAAASNGNQRLLWRADDNNSPTNDVYDAESRQQETAWSRYLCYVEAMRSQGRKFDQKNILEAMFRGKDLVYRSNATAADCTSS